MTRAHKAISDISISHVEVWTGLLGLWLRPCTITALLAEEYTDHS